MATGSIVLVTCTAWPDLSVSDRCLADALRARGVVVEAAPWNGPFAPFAGARAVVIRSSWDYHDVLDDYRRWLGRLDPSRTFNPVDLVTWNLEKTYLLDLAARGATLPPTAVIAPEPHALAQALRDLALTDAVIKPTVGASGFGVERVTPGAEADALRRLLGGKRAERLLVQEFVPEIAGGEMAGVFFDGVFSHGLRRVPASGEFRVNSQYGGRMEAAALDGGVVDAMQAVIASLPVPSLYARVDGLLRQGRFVLMEVEVNEPGLGMHHAPGAGERFADALLARLPVSAG